MILNGRICRTDSGRPKQRGRNDTFRLGAETQEEVDTLRRLQQFGRITQFSGSAHRERLLNDLRNTARALQDVIQGLPSEAFPHFEADMQARFNEYFDAWRAGGEQGLERLAKSGVQAIYASDTVGFMCSRRQTTRSETAKGLERSSTLYRDVEPLAEPRSYMTTR